jgi:hypothetical protein
MGELMEIAFLIGGILIGGIGVLTVINTLKLRPKTIKVTEPTEEQKRQEEQFQAMLDFKG